MSNYVEKFANLSQWVIDNGGYVDPDIYIDLLGEGCRALRTSQTKTQGEELIKIPSKCCLTSAKNGSEFCYEICHQLVREFSLGEKSFYYPYLQSLPTIENMSDYCLLKYTKDDIAELKELSVDFSSQLEKYFDDCNNIFNNYILTDNTLPDEWQTLEKVKYVNALYHTRSWNILGMIPLIDLSNHHQNPMDNNAIANTNEMRIFKTTRTYQKEEELVWTYTFLSPMNLYLNYGIDPTIFQNNYLPYTIMRNVWYDEKVDKTVLELKERLLDENKFGKDKMIVLYTAVGLERRVLEFMRIITLNKTDIDILKLTNPELKVENINVKEVLTMNNEMNAVRILANVVKSFNIPKLDERYVDLPKYKTLVKSLKLQRQIIELNIRNLHNYWLGFLNNQPVTQETKENGKENKKTTDN